MKILNILKPFFFLAVLSLLATACTKEEYLVPASGEAQVSILLDGVDEGEESSMKMAAASGEKISNVQQVTIPFNEEFSLQASLEAEVPTTVVRKVNMAAGNRAAASKTITTLPQGILYRVVVYDETGKYATDKVYTVGVSTNATFQLNAGKSYTFLAFSIRSSSEVPAVNTTQNLSTVSLSGLNGSSDFMYFRSTLTLNAGDNNLNVVLKHLFTQITTSINAAAVGLIESSSVSLGPHHSSVGVKLADASISYNGTAGTTSLAFTGIGTAKITSTPTIINHPSTTAGVLTIASIKAGGTTRTGLQVTGLNIQPGVKYNLNLTLTPKFGISLGGYTWAPANLVYNNGNYGFAANQGVYGDQWQVNALLPIGRGAGSEGQQAYDPAKDPCTKVASNGGNWRTPTMAQLQAITGANRNEKPIFHVRYDLPGQPRASYNGVGGLFIGITTQPAQADIDNYVFLPYAGESSWGQGQMGTYWTVTPSSANNERFQFNTGDVTWPYSSQYYNAGGSIRCVKAQ